MFRTEKIDVEGKRFILRPNKVLFLNSGWSHRYLRDYRVERKEGVIITGIGVIKGTGGNPYKAYGIEEESRKTIPFHLLELEDYDV